jgi:hypothetical protein
MSTGFRSIKIEGDERVHFTARHGTSSVWNHSQTVCLIDDADGAILFTKVKDAPTCPFCIRDAALPDEMKNMLMEGAF